MINKKLINACVFALDKSEEYAKVYKEQSHVEMYPIHKKKIFEIYVRKYMKSETPRKDIVTALRALDDLANSKNSDWVLAYYQDLTRSKP